jgi:chemotaxis protein MotB
MRTHLLLLALLATACVGKKKFDESQSALAETRTELAAVQADLAALQAEQTATKAALAEAEQTLAARQKELAALEFQLKAERADKAELLKTRSQLKASIQEMTTALAELAARKAAAEARVAEFRDLVSRFQDLINAGKLQVKILDGRMVVQLATDVLFASGSAALASEGRTAVREVADVLKSIPDRRFQVEGHTDNVPIRTEKYPSNWELASARALMVVNEMVQVGMPTTRISAASYGENDPVATNKTAEGKALNRRIQIVIVPDLSGLPGYEQLEALSQD